MKKYFTGIFILGFILLSNVCYADIGSVIAFATDSVADDFLTCNGSAVSRATYSELFAEIGTMYGDGDGSTTFNLPDYRGVFLRGLNHGSGIDPDASSRQDRGDGVAGDYVGTYQSDVFKSHRHSSLNIHSHRGSTNDGRYNLSWSVGVGEEPYYKIPYEGGAETRPINIAVIYGIRYNDEKGIKATTYDSGWFATSANNEYTKTHNLGTDKMLVVCYGASNSSGSGMSTIKTLDGEGGGADVYDITNTTFKYSYGVHDKIRGKNRTNFSYSRIIATAIE